MTLRTAAVAALMLCCLALAACGSQDEDGGRAAREGGDAPAAGESVKIYPDPAPGGKTAEKRSPETEAEPKAAAKPPAKGAMDTKASHQGTIRIGAERLYAAYGGNADEADKVYLGKRVAVTGEIWRVVVEARDSFGKLGVVRHPYVTFKSGSDFGTVQCFFEPEDADVLRGLRPGRTVTIIGECAGRKGFVQNVHVRASRLAL